MHSVLFLAAENGALPGGKVGGVGDVVRDLPKALAGEGWRVRVATPSYGTLHRLTGAEPLGTVLAPFRGSQHEVEVWRLVSDEGVENIILHHALFEEHGAGRIYFDEDIDRPFATDANKFAFYCVAAASWIRSLNHPPDIVHLHDWHAAFYLPLIEFSHEFDKLRRIRTVFTIHNLSYQGTRPLDGDESSLAAWFHHLDFSRDAVADPVHTHCINPMAAAIRLADRVSTVSPTYAREICLPSNPDVGFIGGEGLESLLQDAADEGRLAGVLNGCFYGDSPGRRPGCQRILVMLVAQLLDWQLKAPANEAHKLELERVA